MSPRPLRGAARDRLVADIRIVDLDQDRLVVTDRERDKSAAHGVSPSALAQERRQVIITVVVWSRLCNRCVLSSEFRLEISTRTSNASGEQQDGSCIEEGCCRGDSSLEVLGQTAITAEPGEEALDDPASRMHGEADLTGLLADDLDDDPGRIRHALGGVGAIGEHPFNEWQQRERSLEQRDGAVAILGSSPGLDPRGPVRCSVPSRPGPLSAPSSQPAAPREWDERHRRRSPLRRPVAGSAALITLDKGCLLRRIQFA